MNVVLDTNVLVAAFSTRGLCTLLFEIALNRHRLFISPYQIKEIIRAFQRTASLPPKVIRDILRYLRDIGSIVEPDPLPKRACQDRFDDRLLALAKHVRADCLVTGDTDLLVMKRYRGVKIVTPRQFWEMNLYSKRVMQEKKKVKKQAKKRSKTHPRKQAAKRKKSKK